MWGPLVLRPRCTAPAAPVVVTALIVAPLRNPDLVNEIARPDSTLRKGAEGREFDACSTHKKNHSTLTNTNQKETGSVVEWLKRRTDDQHGLGSKPTCTVLLGPWERYFTALSLALWSWQAVLNYSNISTKLLASPEAGRGNCLPYI